MTSTKTEAKDKVFNIFYIKSSVSAWPGGAHLQPQHWRVRVQRWRWNCIKFKVILGYRVWTRPIRLSRKDPVSKIKTPPHIRKYISKSKTNIKNTVWNLKITKSKWITIHSRISQWYTKGERLLLYEFYFDKSVRPCFIFISAVCTINN